MSSSLDELEGGFSRAPVPENEPERIAALRALDILDSAEEEIYDTIVRAAAEICHTSMASLTLIDSDRQWFKAKVGLLARETARDISFCGHAVTGSQMLVVEDALDDERFRFNPFVQGAPNIRFYAGMPLVTDQGMAVGTLCVIDKKPQKLSTQQRTALEVLANSAMRILKLRQDVRANAFAKAVDTASDGFTISSTIAGELTIIYANESFLRLSGYSYVEVMNRPALFPLGRDCDEAIKAMERAELRTQMTTVECQFRRKDGAQRWDRVAFVPYVDNNGVMVYLVSVHRDITEARLAQEQSQQLYAMRTTLASISHVVNNFLNSAQLYSSVISAQTPVDPKIQRAFSSALEDTRGKLVALNRLPSFKERPTPFGFSMLDTDEES